MICGFITLASIESHLVVSSGKAEPLGGNVLDNFLEIGGFPLEDVPAI